MEKKRKILADNKILLAEIINQYKNVSTYHTKI